MAAREPTPEPLRSPRMTAAVRPPVGYLVFLCGTATLAGFLFGLDCSVINGTVAALAQAFGTSAATTGLAVASVLLGSAVGAFFAAQLADRFGRRAVMLVMALLFCTSAWGSGAAQGAVTFTAWRVLGGLAIGAASVVAPAYIAEVAPPALRGRLATLQQLAIVLGVLLAFLSNFFIARAAGGADRPWLLHQPAWRWMFWVVVVPSAAYFCALLFLPESPRYLVARHRDEEARRVLVRAGGGDAAATLEEIRATVNRERPPQLGDLVAPAGGRLLPVVWVALGLAFFQQAVGVNAIIYYGELLWKTAGFTEHDALFINVVIGLVLIVSTLTAMGLVDRVGRRWLLLAGSAGMVVVLGAMTAAFMLGHRDAAGQLVLSTGQAVTALVAVHLFMFCFGASWGPVVWVLLGEMFSNRVRGAGLAVAGATVWIVNFGITMTFPLLIASVGLAAVYGGYTAIALGSYFFVRRWVAETKGRTLESM